MQRRQPSPNALRRPVAPHHATRWMLILASAVSCTVGADHVCEPAPSTIFDNIPVNADGTPSAFPEDGVIGLRRYNTCMGRCPDYEVTMGPDAVHYLGFENVLEYGEQTEDVDPGALLRILADLMVADFEKFEDSYLGGDLCRPNFSDSAEAEIWFAIGLQEKRVSFSWGCSSHQISRLSELADRIDEASGALEWAGTGDTGG